MRHGLEKLRNLVDGLTDRDVQLKEETKLLDHIFTSFPIPLLVWSVDVNGKVRALKGNSIMNPSAKLEDELFSEKNVKKALRECKSDAEKSDDKKAHKFLDTNGKVFYMTITRRFTQEGDELGYLGMAWDITSNAIILRNINMIYSEALEDCNKQKILSLCHEALSANQLAKLMAEER